MLPRSFALLLLIASALSAFAQEPSSSDSSGSGSNGGGSSPAVPATPTTGGAPSFDQGFDQLFNKAPSTNDSSAPAASSSADQPSFSLPGGYGNAPETITPGQGIYARPPILFSSSLTEGYNDNIYGASKNPTLLSGTIVSSDLAINNTTSNTLGGSAIGPHYFKPRFVAPAEPVLGSAYTQGALGTSILLSASRLMLSLDLNAGGVYYVDRPGTPFSPNGTISLLFAYKLTPRAQISAIINGQYLNQPDLVLPNAPTQPNTGDYFVSTSKFDLTYQWAARISTVTSLTFNTQDYVKASSQENDFLTTTVGEAFRYALSPRGTGVLEVRDAQTQYKNGQTRDSSTQYLLGGCDVSLSPRSTASVRLGESLCQYQASNTPSQSSPYVESTLSYGYGRASTLTWNTNYGFSQNSSQQAEAEKTFRTGLSLNEVFTAKLSTSMSLSYAHDDYSSLTGGSSSSDDTVVFGVGAQFIVNRSLTLSANITRSQVLASVAWSSYSTDTISLGGTFHF